MTADLKKLWAVFAPIEKRKAVWMLMLAGLTAAAETAGVLSIIPFLSALSRPTVIQDSRWLLPLYQHFDISEPRELIVALGLASAAIVVTSAALKVFAQHAINRFVHTLRHSISSRLLSRYLRQPYEFFVSHNSAELTKNVLSEADQLMFELIQPLSQLLAQGMLVLAVSLLIFLYDPLIAPCIVATLTLLYGAIYGLVRKRLISIGHERQAANAARFQACSEVLGGIKDVKISHAVDAYQRRFAHASRDFSRHMAAINTLGQTPLYLVEAIGYCGLILIALLLLLRSGDVAQVLPALGLYGFAAYRMLPAAQIMYRGFAQLKSCSAALDTIYHDLMLPEEDPGASSDPMPLKREVRLQGVRYAYPSAEDAPVFDNFSLAIPVNASVGIAGRSGAGKSTLMDLLLGLLEPQAGTLSVDGVVIDRSNVGAWQRAVGYVPQHIYLADASVSENIAFGVKRERIDMQAVERAARAAQIHDFVINDLPLGYETTIGERGIRLSGGQRQRIGIARALYRDPPVLFLDEATSALDYETEAALTEAIRSLSSKKTIVVIAHREASLRFCGELVRLSPLRPERTKPAS